MALALHEQILDKRLRVHIQKQLEEAQCGFRIGKVIQNQIFVNKIYKKTRNYVTTNNMNSEEFLTEDIIEDIIKKVRPSIKKVKMEYLFKFGTCRDIRLCFVDDLVICTKIKFNNKS